MTKRTATVVGQNLGTMWHDEVTDKWWRVDVTWAQFGDDLRFQPIELRLRSAVYGVGPDGKTALGAEIRPVLPRSGPARGLAADEIRRLPIGTILNSLRSSAADRMLSNAENRPEHAADYADLAERWSGGRVPLADVARIYREALPRGNPTQAVIDHFDRPRSTVSRWIRECRKVGLLGPATQGKAGEVR